MIELLLANWLWVVLLHFCTHELLMVGMAVYVAHRYCRRTVSSDDEHECCEHDVKENK